MTTTFSDSKDGVSVMPAAMAMSLSRGILRAYIFINLAHVIFKFAGLIQAMVMTRVLPVRTFEMTYVLAFEGCIFALFLVGEQIIGPTLLPVFMRERERDEHQAWHFANALLTLQAVIVLTMVAVLMFFPSTVVRVVTFLKPIEDVERFELAVRSLRLLSPMLIGLSLGSTTYMLLNAYKRFFLAAFGDAAWKLAVAGLLVMALLLRTVPWPSLVVGMLLGSALKLVCHLIGLRDMLRRLRPVWAPQLPALRRMLWLALPLLGGILFALVRDTFNNITIPSAANIEGVLQANSMGRKLHGTIHYLVPYALSIAVFPFFCELSARNQRRQLGDLVTQSGRMLLSVLIPLSLLLAALAEPLTAVVFRGGEFDALAVQRTSVSLMFYTLVIPASAVEAMLMQAFFADHRTLSATLFGVVFSSLSMVLSWLGLRYAGDNELIVLAAIAGGFAVSRTLKTLALTLWLRRYLRLFPPRETLRFLLRIGLTALAAGGTARLVAGQLAGRWGGWIHLTVPRAGIVFAVGGTAGMLAMALFIAVLRVEEPVQMLRWALQKYRGKS